MKGKMKPHNLMSVALMAAVLGGALPWPERRSPKVITAYDIEHIEKAKQKRARKAARKERK